jgi:2-oxoglutarate dehydrogenase complex dehydrogenase (E1) component-like enzyme
MQVANVTIASQLFHLLRRQVHLKVRKPLVLFTPKRYLRGKEAHSPSSDLTQGHFLEVLDDPGIEDPDEVRRILLATGKIALDLIGKRDAMGRRDVAVVRVEQLYPWPSDMLATTVARYERATELVWAQEEPENMGAAAFVRDRLSALFGDDYGLSRATRVASGSPATGSHAMHELEHADLLARAIG